MPRWFTVGAAVVLILMAFAMTVSTWLWLMGLAPYPGDSIMAGRALLGSALAGCAAFLIAGFHV